MPCGQMVEDADTTAFPASSNTDLALSYRRRWRSVGPNLSETSTPSLDRSHPVQTEFLIQSPTETVLPAWEIVRLRSFRDRYQNLCNRFEVLQPGQKLPAIPNSMTSDEFLAAIEDRRAGLEHWRQTTEDTYDKLTPPPTLN